MPEIRRARSVSIPLTFTDDNDDPADWPTGTLTAELRAYPNHWAERLATFTVNDTNRLAVNGAQILLELTAEQSAQILPHLSQGWADVAVEGDTSACEPFAIDLIDSVTWPDA